MHKVTFKHFVLLFGFILSAVCGNANETKLKDGNNAILIKESKVASAPKGSTIDASINGHTLTVAFTENLGQVAVEISTAAGVTVDCLSTLTPTGFQCYIPSAGDYIVTFTLPNGDEYYGEFTVTD